MRPRNIRKNNEKTCLVSVTFPAFFSKNYPSYTFANAYFHFFALINFHEWSYFEKFAHINFREFSIFAKVNERESFCARKFLHRKVSVLKVHNLKSKLALGNKPLLGYRNQANVAI